MTLRPTDVAQVTVSHAAVRPKRYGRFVLELVSGQDWTDQQGITTGRTTRYRLRANTTGLWFHYPVPAPGRLPGIADLWLDRLEVRFRCEAGADVQEIASAR